MEYSHPQKPRTAQSSYIYGGLCLISLLVIGIILYTDLQKPKETFADAEDIFVQDFFADIVLEGQSAVVYDITQEEIIFAHNATTTLPLASITKLMSAYTARTNAPDILSVTITPEDLLLEGDQGLFAYEVWRLTDLLDFSLVTSSNDAISAIAATVGGMGKPYATHAENKQAFSALMNKTASDIGLTSMRFYNETGLDADDLSHAGGYGSALDVARLIALLTQTYPELVEQTRYPNISLTSLTGYTHVGRNTNLSANAISGLLVSKTGFTDLAGGNLAVVFDHGLNRPIAVVVLGSNIEGRFKDVQTLINATKAHLQASLLSNTKPSL